MTETETATRQLTAEESAAMHAALCKSGSTAAPHARPLSEWHEDDGPVLWWRFPVTESPYIGTPLDRGSIIALQIVGANEPFLQTRFHAGGWPGYHTHWTRFAVPAEPQEDRP